MINFAPFCVLKSQRDGVRSARARTRRKSLLATYRIRLEVASFCVDNRGHAYNRTDDFLREVSIHRKRGVGVILSRGKFCSQQTQVSLPKSYLGTGRRLRDWKIKLFIFKFAADIRHFVFLSACWVCTKKNLYAHWVCAKKLPFKMLEFLSLCWVYDKKFLKKSLLSLSAYSAYVHAECVLMRMLRLHYNFFVAHSGIAYFLIV
jgi:hypothetical protein